MGNAIGRIPQGNDETYCVLDGGYVEYKLPHGLMLVCLFNVPKPASQRFLLNGWGGGCRVDIP